MGVPQPVAAAVAVVLDERVRMLRALERRATETPGTPAELLDAVRELLLEAEAETEPYRASPARTDVV